MRAHSPRTFLFGTPPHDLASGQCVDLNPGTDPLGDFAEVIDQPGRRDCSASHQWLMITSTRWSPTQDSPNLANAAPKAPTLRPRSPTASPALMPTKLHRVQEQSIAADHHRTPPVRGRRSSRPRKRYHDAERRIVADAVARWAWSHDLSARLEQPRTRKSISVGRHTPHGHAALGHVSQPRLSPLCDRKAELVLQLERLRQECFRRWPKRRRVRTRLRERRMSESADEAAGLRDVAED